MVTVSWYELPQQKPRDMRDRGEHLAVAAALEKLPEDHPAQAAYAEGVGTIPLTHLVRDQPALVEALTNAYLDGYHRSLQRWSGFRP